MDVAGGRLGAVASVAMESMPPQVTSTYRVQLSAKFPFAAAAEAVPYLSDLGVSHLYVSPILQARRGSMHGYDVVDPTRVSADLGGERGLRELVASLHDRAMGLVVDSVPNHMATSDENPWWVSMLAAGQDAWAARVFDVDWDAGGGKVRLPVLGGPLEDVAHELRVEDGWVYYHDQRFPLATGTSRLSEQHYELMDWRRAATDGNYRRFFSINELVGVRQEDPEVFEATHATTLRLVGEGLIDGLRIDHIDGLADPAAYLERLHARGVPWVVVEKILSPGESLPHWPVAGTTGYEFLNLADGVLMDGRSDATFTDRYTALTGRDPNSAALAARTKRQVLERAFATDVAGVARHLPGDKTENVAAVVALATALPVYRTYVTEDLAAEDITPFDRAVVEGARGTALDQPWGMDPALSEAALDRLVDAVLLRQRAPEAVRRFQQLTPPAMAKGVEDTALYRDARMVARNEVGGDITRFGRTVQEFHLANAEREERWPRSMLATSTHDTKRGEDVRARLMVLTEMAQPWWDLAERWTRRLGGDVVTADALLLWQTMVGAWPLERERCWEYMRKAVREAELHTDWEDPDLEYETALEDLVDRAYADSSMRGELEDLIAVIQAPGQRKAQVLTLLRLTSPGIPDTYQGTEHEQLVLVDPDNRRPVSFSSSPSDKFTLTRLLLRLRREHPEYLCGYEPLSAPEPLLSFARAQRQLVVVARRLEFAPVPEDAQFSLGSGVWREQVSGQRWEGPSISAVRLLEGTSFAVLVKERRGDGGLS